MEGVIDNSLGSRGLWPWVPVCSVLSATGMTHLDVMKSDVK